jgi:hypothetical protein
VKKISERGAFFEGKNVCGEPMQWKRRAMLDEMEEWERGWCMCNVGERGMLYVQRVFGAGDGVKTVGEVL